MEIQERNKILPQNYLDTFFRSGTNFVAFNSNKGNSRMGWDQRRILIRKLQALR